MSLTSCLHKAGPALSGADKRAILSKASAYRKSGMAANDAAIKAVDDVLAAVSAELMPLTREMLKTPVKAEAPEFMRDTKEPVTSRKDVVGEQGGRSADDTTTSAADHAVDTGKRSPLTGKPIFSIQDANGAELEKMHIAATADEAMQIIRERPARRAANAANPPPPIYAPPKEQERRSGWKIYRGEAGSHLNPDGFYYHVTTHAAAREIIRSGLVPNANQMFTAGVYPAHSKGRAFLTDLDGVNYWREKVEQQLQHAYDNPPAVAVVRIPKSAVPNAQIDDVGTKDASANAYYVEGRVGTNESTAPKSDGASFSRGSSTPADLTRSPDQSHASTLNTALVKYGLGPQWSNAYEAVELPYPLSGIRQAFKVAFGRDVRAVAPTAKRFDIFNGVFVGGNIYVNAAGSAEFLTVAGHELWHDIAKSRPDLIAWYRQQAGQYYRNVDAYQAKLNKLLESGEKPYTAEKAVEELEADFLGDSLTDPKFLAQLAEASPGKFRHFLTIVQLWLAKVVRKLRGANSEQYVSDVEALRDHLRDVLVAFAEGKKIERVRAPAYDPSFLRVFHGSPHEFDKFSLDAMGSGEGHQAYGWGLYFAGKKEVADHYRKVLSAGSVPTFSKEGKTLSSAADVAEAYYQKGTSYNGYSGRDVVTDFRRDGDYGWSVQVQSLGGDGKPKAGERPRWHSTMPDIKDLTKRLTDEGYTARSGKLYEVEIPEEGSYLLWDKPIGEQPAAVKEALSKIDMSALDKESRSVLEDRMQKMSVPGFYGVLQTDDNLRGPKGASEYLHSLGIAGIKYLDGTSRNAGDGSYNYVVFDDNAVKIEAAFSRSAPPDGDAPLFSRANGGFDLPEFSAFNHFIETTQDRYNRWKQATQAIRKQGGLVDDTNDFYAAEERYWSIVANQSDEFKAEVEDFVKAVRKDDLTLEQVAEYAYALHAPERNAEIAKKNLKFPDGGSGMLDQEAQDIIDAATRNGTKPALDRHAATLHAWTEGTRDVLENNGLISPAERAAWEAPYQNYVPLRGQPGVSEKKAGTGQGFDIRGKESQRALGRQSQAGHIIENIVGDRQRALVRAGKNEVLRRFAKFVMDNPDPDLWEINAVEKRRSLVTDDNGDQQVVEHLDMDKLPEHTVAVKDGGDTIYIRIHDDKLLEQLKNLNRDDVGKFVGAVLWANRQMSRMYTTLSPVFALFTNPVRDLQAGALNMVGSRGFKAAGKLAIGVPLAWGPAFKAEVMGKPSPMYREFQMTGGKTGFLDYKDVDAQAKELKRLVAHADVTWNPATWVTGHGWQTPFIAGSKAVHTLLGGIETITGVMENATRYAAYKAAREAGESPASAASLSKNLTVNFNRKGTMTSHLSMFFLFFNPAVQGTARMIEALKNPKVMATMGAAMTGVALLAMQNAGAGDDDDGVAWWDKIPDEVKERNLIFILSPESKEGEKIPGTRTGRYLKIPMPYGYNVFAVMANVAVDQMRHEQDPKRGKSHGKAAAAVAKAFLGSWVPVAEFGASFDNSQATVLAATPPVLKPIAQNLMGVNAFGRKMYRNDAQAQNLPDSQNYGMADRGTVGQKIAEGLNTATGGSKFREGAISVTPASMNNALRGYGGAPVTFAADMANVFLRNGVNRDSPEWFRAPFVKQLYGRIDSAADQSVAYDKIAEIEKKATALKRATDAGDRKEVGMVLKAEGPLATIGNAAQDTSKALSEIRKAEIQIIDDPKMGDTQKALRLRQLDLKARQASQALNRAVGRAIDRRDQVEATADRLLTEPARGR